MSQLYELSKPFPDQYLGQDDKGRQAVDHTVVTQRLLEVVGPYTTEVAHLLRNDVTDFVGQNKTWPGGHMLTGVVLRLTCEIDGRAVSIEEVGSCELPQMKDGDGERMKHALSDALKRCSMRLGLGLHMWSQDHYYLNASLAKREGVTEAKEGATA